VAKLKGPVVKDSVSRKGEGVDIDYRLTSDGSLVTKDWRMAMVDEGRAFVVNVGAFTTPVTGGGTAGVTMDPNAPEFILSIPNNISVYPKRILIAVQPGAMAAEADETEIVIGVDQDQARGTTGTATAETIYNLNTLHSRASSCTATSAYTANTTLPVLDIELAHAVQEVDSFTHGGGSGTTLRVQRFELLYEPDAPPRINGPAMLCIYWGGTIAALGFATIEWYELPESD